ncbi:LIM domain-binding protein 2 [Chionoecetes opilio]|uniref:LIM domain-binding protein 2 n=1 Tax=Chionoecetes opilio TaxID=41210 RepID=A0A8J4XY79_CHIOP|nr:LIM domain-binding protein 2 [Chionoecetes opilio]
MGARHVINLTIARCDHKKTDGRRQTSGVNTSLERHTPYFGQPDFRLYELNKRLQQRSEESDNLWWDAFATEFFEDDATLTLTFCLEDGPKRYTIGRTLIPRYFRSIFEGGVTELYYSLKHPKESFHNTSITLDCDQCTMVTHHGKPMYTKVCTDGRLILEFTFDDLMRIKSWHFAVRAHRELIPRSVVAMQQDPQVVETLSKNITRQGITNHTLNYLRLCVILEPMQELMSRHKAYALSPRDCLKTTLFQKWQRMVAPPDRETGETDRETGETDRETGETDRETGETDRETGETDRVTDETDRPCLPPHYVSFLHVLLTPNAAWLQQTKEAALIFWVLANLTSSASLCYGSGSQCIIYIFLKLMIFYLLCDMYLPEKESHVLS